MTRPPLLHALLLAEFDIDKGSTLRRTLPESFMSSLPLDANVIAEMMLPEGGHNRSDDSTVFVFHREKGAYCLTQGAECATAGAEASSGKLEGTEASQPPFLFCYSVVMTRRDDTVRRGAVMRSLAICSRYQFLDQFHDALAAVLEQYFLTPQLSVLTALETALTDFDVSAIPLLNLRQRTVLRNCIPLPRKSLCDVEPLSPSVVPWEYNTTVIVQDTPFVITVPLTSEADVLSKASVSLLVRKFGKFVGTIYNAVLLEKRVLFCGDKTTSANEVGQCVVACCAMVSPSLSGVFRRAFPYACLTQLDFLSVPGFIAGVTNPMFGTKPMWWDVMANVATGEVVTAEQANAAAGSSKGGSVPAPPPGVPFQGAVALFSPEPGPTWKPLDEMVFEKVAAGVAFGEAWLRDALHTHTLMLVNMCAKYTATRSTVSAVGGSGQPGSTAAAQQSKMVEMNLPRLEALAMTSLFQSYAASRGQQAELEASCFHKSVDPDGNLRSHVAALKSGTFLKRDQLDRVYRELEGKVTSPPDVEGLVVLLPESSGGLHPIAAGLFNGDLGVRTRAWRLLSRVETHDNPAVKAAFGNLNMFTMMAYQRVGVQAREAEVKRALLI